MKINSETTADREFLRRYPVGEQLPFTLITNINPKIWILSRQNDETNSPKRSRHSVLRWQVIKDISRFDTQWGPLRVITPTLCVMDRLIAFWAWGDRQSWDQAVMVCKHSDSVDYKELVTYAKAEGADPKDINALKREAGKA